MLDGKNTLAYFVCALFEPSDDQSPTKRPKLRESKPLPLGHWDRLYYLLNAEVRRLYRDLQQRYGQDFGNGNVILHEAGRNGAKGSARHPFSAVGMASLLEDMWRNLTDHRLVLALDRAIRTRKEEDDLVGAGVIKEANIDVAPSAPHTTNSTDKAEGLLDVNTMTPSSIYSMVWREQDADARHKTGKRIEEQSLLASCRAEVLEAAAAGKRPAEQMTEAAICTCKVKCACRALCNTKDNQCSCAYLRNQVGIMVTRQARIHRDAYDSFDSPRQALPNNMLGAVTNEAAQMQIAALANRDPYIVQACYATTEAADKLDKEILEMRRARSNTNTSELVYVPPPRTPARRNKDAYPLGFYGDTSGQRYPTFRANVHDLPPPVYGASFYSGQVPARKPVPPPIAPPLLHQSNPGRSRSREQIPTPESSPLDQAFTHPGPVIYPAIPKSQSQGLFTQSFPVAARGNPREADTDTTVSAAAYTNLAEEAHNSIRPFSEDAFMHSSPAAPYRPTLFSAATSPDGIQSQKTRNIDLAKPQPPLPPPDFISPRPALKQRYVSAGGNAKLQDRVEIAGPAFVQMSSGATMNKDELFQKLSDPDFVKHNFGEGAATKMSTSIDMTRSSQEFADSKHDSGQELFCGSRDSLIKHEKRERAQSGSSVGSGRFRKLTRVFSRKNSTSE